jgi:hypothetical protein
MFYSRYAGEQDAKLLSTDRSACMQSGLGIYGLVSKVKTGL